MNILSQKVIPKQFTPTLPTIEKIFSDNHSWVATISAQQITTIIATGDVIPARAVNYQTITRHDSTWPYLKTAAVTNNSDITFINLESPLIDSCPVTQEGMIFCGDARNMAGLLFAGADVASLANNHISNYGLTGIQNTIKLLNSNGILTTGINGPVIKNIKGVKFAFLGYDYIGSHPEETKIIKEISDAKKQADVVIVTFHWGTEYTSQPNNRQKYLGHLAVDAGADLIIGNHPHWIQPIEIYKGKLITYAHGNFVFDQMWSQKTREGVVGRYTFFGKDLIDVEFMPVQIDDYGQPHFVENPQKQSILDDMKTQSLVFYNLSNL